jgi:hypothetical protein
VQSAFTRFNQGFSGRKLLQTFSLENTMRNSVSNCNCTQNFYSKFISPQQQNNDYTKSKSSLHCQTSYTHRFVSFIKMSFSTGLHRYCIMQVELKLRGKLCSRTKLNHKSLDRDTSDRGEINKKFRSSIACNGTEYQTKIPKTELSSRLEFSSSGTAKSYENLIVLLFY